MLTAGYTQNRNKILAKEKVAILTQTIDSDKQIATKKKKKTLSSTIWQTASAGSSLNNSRVG